MAAHLEERDDEADEQRADGGIERNDGRDAKAVQKGIEDGRTEEESPIDLHGSHEGDGARPGPPSSRLPNGFQMASGVTLKATLQSPASAC